MLTEALRLDCAAFAASRFALHGRCRLTLEGRALRVEASGPFNIEFVQALGRMLDAAARCLPEDGRFVEWVALRDSLLMPPEAFELLRAYTLRAQRGGYRPQAMLLLVPAGTEGRELLLPRLQALWSASRPVQVFEDAAAAQAALQRRLAAFE